jgi:hypothetical protein
LPLAPDWVCMKPRLALLLALAVTLAGCSVGFTDLGDAGPDGPTATPSGTPTATPADASPTATATPEPTEFDFADPANDRLGWEDGYWYNESLPVNGTDGLNQTELEQVIARASARVEYIRGLEFDQTVPVEIITREEYRQEFADGENYTESFRAFDNTKFEGLFLIGEREDALAVQNANQGSSVLGFYSPREKRIVVVAESDSPQLSGELTLGHELLHAVQDQEFNLSSYDRPTREVYNAYNGLFEGDASYVQQRYEEHCDSGEWECVSGPSSNGGGGGDFHLGVYILNYFPYADGPVFIDYVYQHEGWEGVNALYEEPPASTEQVALPAKYGEDEPTAVTFEDRNTNGWERVVPVREESNRPPYATFGQSGLVAMFAYTLYDPYNQSAVIAPDDFLNREGNALNQTDPFNYSFAAVEGWDGDRMHIYENPEYGPNQTAYVWKLQWDSGKDAREFADTYEALLVHYGATEQGCAGDTCTYVIANGPYADAFRVSVEGDTVTIVNAPDTGSIGDVYGE